MSRIQNLRDRICLLKRQVTEDKDGSFSETWQEEDTVWAHVTPYLEREVFGEGWNALTPVPVKYKVLMRFRRQRFERIRWEEMILAMLCPPLVDQRHQWMTCLFYGTGEER